MAKETETKSFVVYEGKVALKRVQLKDQTHFQMENSGRTFHPVFIASDKLTLTWHVELGLIEVLDAKDCIMVPMTSVVSFKV